MPIAANVIACWPGAAEAVERDARRLDRPTGGEHGHAADAAAVVAGGVAVADDHVVDVVLVDAGARGQCVEHLGQHLLRVDVVQRPVRLALATRRPRAVDDPGLSRSCAAHDSSDILVRGVALASRSRMTASISCGSIGGLSTCGPRIQPWAMPRIWPDDSITWPVTSDDCGRCQPGDDRGDPFGAEAVHHLVGQAEVFGEPGERAGCDRVGGDAVAAELLGGDQRERGDAGLGRAVVGLTGVAVDARHRRRVDQAGVVGLAGLGPVAPVLRGDPAGRPCAL